MPKPPRPPAQLPKGATLGLECLDKAGLATLRRGLETRQEEVGEEVNNLTGAIQALEELFTTLPERDLIDFVAKTGAYKGELHTLTPAQFQKLTGKFPNRSILNKEGKVRWEYALDIIASERGFATGDDLKYAIERALQTKQDLERMRESLRVSKNEAASLADQLAALEEWEKVEEKRKLEEAKKYWATPPEQRKVSNYQHFMADFNLRPLQIKQHLIEVHHVTPNIPRKGYEREVWHGQHESAHKSEDYERAVNIPKQVPGTPERGVQSAFTPEGKITSQVVAPKGKGVVTQSSLEGLAQKRKWGR